VVSPIGFVSDHLEVIWDLDNEAKATAADLGLGYARAATPGTDPRFVTMIRELVRERTGGHPRDRLGAVAIWDVCPENCCPTPRRPRGADQQKATP
jgi:ferrochelatase